MVKRLFLNNLIFSEKGKNQPYFVERSKNHMLALYLKHDDRGQLKITSIKRIHGDIWKLHDEVKSHVQEMIGRKIASQVCSRKLLRMKIRGDSSCYKVVATTCSIASSNSSYLLRYFPPRFFKYLLKRVVVHCVSDDSEPTLYLKLYCRSPRNCVWEGSGGLITIG